MCLTFPVHEPLFIFTVLIVVILLSPFLFRLIKLPDVASFILMGVLIGPYGFNILSRDSSIELLGTIGLLYIMFLAGLELDSEKLKAGRKKSIIFGLITFLIPFLLGLVVSKSLLQLENNATILVSIMFSTHTLVAYPIVRKLGVNRDVSVLTAIGGTIITDTLVLMILSIVTQSFQRSSVSLEILKLLSYFSVYTVLVFYSFPKIARWFFKYVKRDRPVHYLFLLCMVCVSSLIADLIGIEAIIGAFIAGLALNKSIPRNSLLMHHVDFVGNVLFIPVFLIGIGMLINTRILFTGTYLWYVAAILTATAFAGKWLAALISQKIIGLNNIQRNLLFGLTSSHAAATIAIILIGYEKQMIDINIFNASVLIILVSSLVASFITERYGRKFALSYNSTEIEKQPERILVSISNPDTMAGLVEVANKFNAVYPTESVYVLSILNENKGAGENILKVRESLENSLSEFNNLSETLKVITRVDLSISGGIIRAAKEYMVSDIVFGWGEKTTTSQRIFGNIFDHLLTSMQTLFVVKLTKSLNVYKRIVANIPANFNHEYSFVSIIRKINKLPVSGCELEFRAEDEASFSKIKPLLSKRNTHRIIYNTKDFNKLENEPETINIILLLRKQSVSYNPKHNTVVEKMISSNSINDFILVVPGFE